MWHVALDRRAATGAPAEEAPHGAAIPSHLVEHQEVLERVEGHELAEEGQRLLIVPLGRPVLHLRARGQPVGRGRVAQAPADARAGGQGSSRRAGVLLGGRAFW